VFEPLNLSPSSGTDSGLLQKDFTCQSFHKSREERKGEVSRRERRKRRRKRRRRRTVGAIPGM
jgi:hypothetical protein